MRRRGLCDEKSPERSLVVVQRADERYHGEHGWLETDHAFSPNYDEPATMHFGALHVFNDDRIAPGKGFPQHSHRDMEIVTYVLEGALEHRDSMGNHGIVQRGGVQYMSAGTGVSHLEGNPSPTERLRFLQMWVPPRTVGLAPVYGQQNYDVVVRRNFWLDIASGVSDVRADVALDRDAVFSVACLENVTLSRELDASRFAFFFVAAGEVKTSVTLPSGEESEFALRGGDALRIERASKLSTTGSGEVVLWDVSWMPSIW